jgi:hypothetical protein
MPHDTVIALIAAIGLTVQFATLALRYADYRCKAADGQKKKLPEEQPNQE